MPNADAKAEGKSMQIDTSVLLNKAICVSSYLLGCATAFRKTKTNFLTQ